MTTKASLIFTISTILCGFYSVSCSINHEVLFADVVPKIISDEKEITINAGENYTLKCQCLHHITWRHFNTTILNAEDDQGTMDAEIYERTLRLNNVSARDTGYYYCMLTETRSGLNFDQDLEYAAEIGEASRIYVYVNDPDSPLVPCRNKTIVGKLYSKIIVPCKPSSKSTEVELINGDRAIDQAKYNPTVGYYYILTDSSMNRTSFVCQPKIAENFNSRIEFNIIVEPYENFLNTPKLFNPPKEAIGDGDNLTIQCNVLLKNSDDYEMTWILPHEIGVERYNITNQTKPDKNIPEIKLGRSILTINEATFEENKGLYTCVVKNKANNLSSNRSTFVNMWFKFKPVVKGQKDYYIKAGENVTAKCVCQAFPSCEMKWYYTKCTPDKAQTCASRDWDEVELKDAEVIRRDELTLVVLKSTITFQPSGPGVIRCKANNKLGVTSERSQVWLNDLDSDFKIDSTNLTQTILIGDSVTLTCAATIYNHSNINWYRNSRLLETNKDYEVIQDDTTYSKRKLLIIKNITQSEIYECATNLTNTSESTLYSIYTRFTDRSFVRVNVEKPQSPEFIDAFREEIDLEIGERLYLICNATGTPKPTITWLMDNRPIPSDATEMENGDAALSIKSVNMKDSGTYECQVSNRLDSIGRKFQIKVNSPQSWLGWLIGMSIISIFLIFGIIFVSICLYREKKLRKNIRQENFEKGKPDQMNAALQADLQPYNRIFDLPKENFKLLPQKRDSQTNQNSN